MTLVWCCIATALLATEQPASAGLGSTRVAVIDVPAASQRYQRTGDLEAEFEQRRVKFNQQRDAMRERIDRTGRSLQEEFKPGTKEFDERRKQLAMYQAELQWFVDAEGQKIEEALARSLREIYNDIHSVVREVAEERGIDVVLAADRLPDEPVKSSTQARQQIVLQKVVYWSPRVDLTDEVVARLNAKYKARRLAPTPGLARPPLAGEDGVPVRSRGKTPTTARP